MGGGDDESGMDAGSKRVPSSSKWLEGSFSFLFL